MKKLFKPSFIVHLNNGIDLTKRTAKKKEHKCCNSGKFQIGGEPADKNCSHIIKIGEKYYDTNDRAGIWKTSKYCLSCGDELIKRVGTTGTTIGTIFF